MVLVHTTHASGFAPRCLRCAFTGNERHAESCSLCGARLVGTTRPTPSSPEPGAARNAPNGLKILNLLGKGLALGGAAAGFLLGSSVCGRDGRARAAAFGDSPRRSRSSPSAFGPWPRVSAGATIHRNHAGKPNLHGTYPGRCRRRVHLSSGVALGAIAGAVVGLEVARELVRRLSHRGGADHNAEDADDTAPEESLDDSDLAVERSQDFQIMLSRPMDPLAEPDIEAGSGVEAEAAALMPPPPPAVAISQLSAPSMVEVRVGYNGRDIGHTHYRRARFSRPRHLHVMSRGLAGVRNSMQESQEQLDAILEMALDSPAQLLREVQRQSPLVESLTRVHNGEETNLDRLPWQLLVAHQQLESHIDQMSYEDLYELFGGGPLPQNATTEDLEAIPVHTIAAKHICMGFGSAGYRACPICLQSFCLDEEVRSLPRCSHVFHKECVDTWLLCHRGDCPVCRASLISSETKMS